MKTDLYQLSQGDLIALANQFIEADKHFAQELWKFPSALRQSLDTETLTFTNLFTHQNFNQGDKERIVAQKNVALNDVLIPFIRKVVHYVKALADDPENTLNAYGYDPGDFPKKEGDVVALGLSIIEGDTQSQGKPWAMSAQMKQDFVNAVGNAQSLMEAAQIAFGLQQETTQTQDESRARLEKIMVRCREWLYSMVPQARHDEILEFYGLKPLKHTPHKPHEVFPAPQFLMFDQMRTMFSWQSVAGATAYKLEIKNTGTQQVFGDTTPANKLYIELAKGDYAAKVRALKETDPQQVSDWSVEIPVVIEFAAPGNLKYNPAPHKFSWDAVLSQSALLYQLVQQGAADDIYLGAATTFVYPFVGTAKFRVRAGNEAEGKWGEWTNWLAVSA